MSATTNLYNTLKAELADSYDAHREVWARQIIKEDIALEDLAPLLAEDPKTANRFLWLLSNVGDVDKQKLKGFLPKLFELRDTYTLIDYTVAFCKYWHLCGVPEEQESEAINLCFQWLNNPKLKVSIKYYCMWVLRDLVPRYPELKGELLASLQAQQELNTATFRKQAGKVLEDLA